MSETSPVDAGPPPEQGEVTRLLPRLREGDSTARERVFELVYDELRRLAGAAMAGERDAHTLQPTALVHEAYLSLTGGSGPGWNDRNHLLATAARAMRSILVDHARARLALKRGGDAVRMTLDEHRDGTTDSGGEWQVLAVHEALERLEAIDADRSRVVELRFFGGLSVEETADALDLSPRTVKRMWRHARAWLLRELAS